MGAIEIDKKRYCVITSLHEYRQSKLGNREYAYDVAEIEVLDAETTSTSNGVVGANNGLEPVAKLLQNLEKKYDPGKKILDESEKSSEGDSAELHRFGSAMEELKLSEAERAEVRARAEEVAREMGIDGDAEFVDGTEEGLSREQKGVKAWFDSSTGKVTVNLANAEGAADVEMSLLHEGAGHKGLRAMFGERFKQFLGNVWDAMPEELRRRAFEGARKYGWDLHTGTEEVLSEMAEKGEFKKYDKLFNRLKGFFGAMLRASGLRSGVVHTCKQTPSILANRRR